MGREEARHQDDGGHAQEGTVVRIRDHCCMVPAGWDGGQQQRAGRSRAKTGEDKHRRRILTW